MKAKEKPKNSRLEIPWTSLIHIPLQYARMPRPQIRDVTSQVRDAGGAAWILILGMRLTTKYKKGTQDGEKEKDEWSWLDILILFEIWMSKIMTSINKLMRKNLFNNIKWYKKNQPKKLIIIQNKI